MKNVLLYGVHSVNLGDDLFFKIILERYPQTRFIIIGPEIYKSILADYKNCVVISKSDSVIKRISRFLDFVHLPKSLGIYLYLFKKYNIDLFLIAGGSLFIEGNSNLPRLIKNIHKLTHIFRKVKICVIGSNFGPCTTDGWRKTVEKSLHYVADVCFRDIQSFRIFSNLPNVRWGNDIVFHQVPSCCKEKDKVLCVNIRSVDSWPTLKPYKERYLQQTKEIIEIYQSKGYSVKMLSFCSQYADNEITDELYEILERKENVSRLYYNGELNDCLEAISTADSILATRFHAIILGLIYNLKIIPISYSIKTENMLKTFGIWDDIYDYNAFCNSSVDSILNKAIESYNINQSNNRQFDYLDKILK